MAEAGDETAKPRMACREIVESDLAVVGALLCEGFPDRTHAYWAAGLRRLAAHTPAADLPRFGYVLCADGAPVGVLLLIGAPTGETGERLCNVSSWYVRPAYRAFAAVLNQRAVHRPGVTYVNISPAPHTRPMIAALGFVQRSAGVFLAPAVPAPGPRAIVHAAGSDRMPPAAGRLLADHAAFGCLPLWLETPEGGYPVVFRRRALGRFRLPCAMLIHCPSLELVEHYAGPLSVALLRRGLPLILASTPRPLRSFVGRHYPARLPIYAKGPAPLAPGDLGYTEAALFGM